MPLYGTMQIYRTERVGLADLASQCPRLELVMELTPIHSTKESHSARCPRAHHFHFL